MATSEQMMGVGFRMPFGPGRDGAFEQLSGPDVVRQGIETILTTNPGERIGLSTFGCGLRRFLMEPNTTATRALMANEITEALRLWEPRIVLTNVEVTPGEDPSLVWIVIAYVHRLDNTEGNLVYPFYLQ